MTTSLKVLRVTQLDTQELDDEFNLLVNKSFNDELLKYLSTTISTKYNKHLLDIINIIIWYFTYFKNRQTIGQSILEWKYSTENKGRLMSRLHLITHLILNTNLISINDLIDKNNKLRILSKLLNLINYLIFLINGDYLFIWLRIFKLKSFYTKEEIFINNQEQQLNNKITERELLWHSYFQLIKFLNKTFNLKKLTIKFNKETINKSKLKDDVDIIHNKCSICNDLLKIPCESINNNCLHLFCYYCIKSYLNLNNSYSCNKCSCQIYDFDLFYS